MDPAKRKIVWSRNVAGMAGMLDITAMRSITAAWGEGERTWRLAKRQRGMLSGDPAKLPEESMFQLVEAVAAHLGAEIAAKPRLAGGSTSSRFPDAITPSARLAAPPPDLAPLALPKRRRALSPVASLSSVDAIASHLRGRFGLVVEGFDQPGIPLDVVRDFARAVDDTLTRYPMIDLRKVAIQNLKKGRTRRVAAICGGRQNLGSTRDAPDWHATEVVLCSSVAKDSEWYKGFSEESEARRQHPPGFAHEPFYSIILHEMGHALDFTGSMLTRGQVMAALKAMHKESPDRGVAFKCWALRRMSAYSFDEALDTIDTGEALAQAFADVLLNGARAAETSKVLHELLVKKAKDQSKRGRKRPPPKGSLTEAMADILVRIAAERSLTNGEIATLTGMSRRAVDDMLGKHVELDIDGAHDIARSLGADIVAVIKEADEARPSRPQSLQPAEAASRDSRNARS